MVIEFPISFAQNLTNFNWKTVNFSKKLEIAITIDHWSHGLKTKSRPFLNPSRKIIIRQKSPEL